MIRYLKYNILVGFALVISACDGSLFWQRPASPVVTPVSQAAPARLVLTPDELVLNVPSGEPCPCPFESTSSFKVAGPVRIPAGWKVGDAGVAGVRPDGLVVAVATGTTVVTLETEGQIATASVRVVDRGGRAAVVVR